MSLSPSPAEQVAPLLTEALNATVALWEALNRIEAATKSEVLTTDVDGWAMSWRVGDVVSVEQAQQFLEDLR